MQGHVREVWKAIMGTVASQVPAQNIYLGKSFPNEKDKTLVVDLKKFNSRNDKDLVAVEDDNVSLVNDATLEDGEIFEDMPLNVADFSMNENGTSSSNNIIASQPIILNKNMFDILNNVNEDVNNVEIILGKNMDDEVNVSSSKLKNMAIIVDNVKVEKNSVKRKLGKEIKTLGPIKLMTRTRKLEMGKKRKEELG
ncbi:hypothetical protein MA16_Dca024124 [Dendrobium catenatum]|uniref:Uncharacterized protein n=1 Tax=Dendrobium catenatum TaxID=906689 RepID=A0A2I0V813_9ASPA|nr:hypothetical protein MA16_Dca024124 [Dendrobium catenatum]